MSFRGRTFQPDTLPAPNPLNPPQKKAAPGSSLKKKAAGIARGPESSIFHLKSKFSDQDRGPPGRSCRSGGDSYRCTGDRRFTGHHSQPLII